MLGAKPNVRKSRPFLEIDDVHELEMCDLAARGLVTALKGNVEIVAIGGARQVLTMVIQVYQPSDIRKAMSLM